MSSHFIDYQLFGDQFSTPEIRAVFDERRMLQLWLDVEAALAAAQADLHLIPREDAEAIARAARVENLDLPAIKRDLVVTAHPLVPVVRELARVAGAAGRWVHWGATTQDVIDTGMVLQLKAAHAILRRDLVTLTRELAVLAEKHRDTVMAGRTHAQQALPITFGFKVATWVAECLRQVERLDEVAPRLFVGELAGAVGTLAGFGPHGVAVQRRALERLGLGVPLIAWHASRDVITEFVTLLALLGGTLARIANEVVQLQRTEIMELEEPFAHGKVGSSTMPHKRNPAHAERMRENLGRLGGLLLSEAVMLKLGETLGRNTAHDLVYEAAMAAVEGKGSFRERLLADPRVAAALSAAELDGLLEPTAYTGLAGAFVDRVVRAAKTLAS